MGVGSSPAEDSAAVGDHRDLNAFHWLEAKSLPLGAKEGAESTNLSLIT